MRFCTTRRLLEAGVCWGCCLAASAVPAGARAAEALNPFSPTPKTSGQREDALPGYIEMSDGSVHYGRLYLTRDKRLKVNDEKMNRQREIPLAVVQQIDCKVLKEWMEKEWRFKELALNEKLYTGKEYPSREYEHTLTLKNGQKVTGGLSGIVYLLPGDFGPSQPGVYRPEVEPERYLLHKRDKGKVGDTLKKLLYVKQIKLGEEAFQEGRAKAAARPKSAKPDSPGAKKNPT